MEETCLKPRVFSVRKLAYQDTSLPRPTPLAPPKSYMTRIESDEKNLRVHRQVRHTQERDTKKGGIIFQNSSRSLDGTDRFLSNTVAKQPFTPLVNRSDFNSLSLKGAHACRMSRRGIRSPTTNTELSFRRFNHNIHVQGAPSGLDYNHFKVVGALMDWSDCCNSLQRYAISETSEGTPASASVPLPGKYSSNSLKQPVRAKCTSASAAIQKSPGKAWSNQRDAVKHDKQTVYRNPPASKEVQQSSRNMWNQKRGVLTRQHRISQIPGSTQLDGGLTWHAQIPQRQKSDRPLIVSTEGLTRRQDEKKMKNHTLKTQELVKKPPEMTIERAMNLVGQTNEEKLISGAVCIQNRCYKREEDREMVHNLHGAKKLLQLFKNDSEEVQRAAAGALRNVVYKNSDNKKDIKDEDGLPIIMSALENTRDKETICQLAGLLWNLSADDTIKELFKESFLCIITKSILLPSSGMKTQENPKYEMIADPKAFLCATGCLRNLSCGSYNLRSDMRKCENLIDSLVFYAQETSGSRKPNDEATENCVCILQNLTYKAEDDFSPQPTKHQEETQNTSSKKITWGCFSQQSAQLPEDAKDEEDPESVHPLQEVQDPHGAELLWSKHVVRMYLSLVACSTRSMTRQAAIGALQNLTDGKRMTKNCC
ncbi:plakophilin-2-like [Anableps anableps]